MTSPDLPPDNVPEADWAEQRLDAGPEFEPEPPAPVLPQAIPEVNEADLVEQETVVYIDDEE